MLPLLSGDPPHWNPPDRGEEQPPPVHSVRGEKTMKIMRTVLAVLAEQIDGAQVSAYHYRVVFKPQAIIPDIDLRGSAQELLENASENANP